MRFFVHSIAAAFLPTLLPHLSPCKTLLHMVQTENRLKELGIMLPPPPQPAANYVPVQRGASEDMLYLSGHLPLNGDGSLYTGKVGGPNGKSLDDGYAAARQVGLNLISTLHHHLDGDLDRVERIVKLFGIVQSDDSFHEQHKVVNGCSDLMVEVFGKERGVHARSAIGTNALPLDISVEIEAIVKVKPKA
jgi:enamine deaminase RidA (YjgF/YER057c/UK114 family)